MELDEINALIDDTRTRLGLEPPPVTPEEVAATVQPVSSRERDVTTRRNRVNKQRADQYMGDVRDYLGKVRRGRSTRAVDPQHPAFSDESEMLRQIQTLNQANRFASRGPKR